MEFTIAFIRLNLLKAKAPPFSLFYSIVFKSQLTMISIVSNLISVVNYTLPLICLPFSYMIQ